MHDRRPEPAQLPAQSASPERAQASGKEDPEGGPERLEGSRDPARLEPSQVRNSMAQRHPRTGEEEAVAWLELVDRGQYAQSWRSAGAVLRRSKTEREWLAALEADRAPAGALVSRELRSAERESALPGAPPGDYLVVFFDAELAAEPQVREVVALAREADQSWKVAAYFFLAPARPAVS